MFEDSDMTSFLFEYFIEEPLSMTIVQHAPDFSHNNSFGALATMQRMFWIDGGPYEMSHTWLRECFFRSIDIDGNGIPDNENSFNLMTLLALETDMTGVLEDFVLFFGGPDMRPGGEAWEVWKGILEFYRNGENIYGDTY